jgi:hypothetical protein
LNNPYHLYILKIIYIIVTQIIFPLVGLFYNIYFDSEIWIQKATPGNVSGDQSRIQSRMDLGSILNQDNTAPTSVTETASIPTSVPTSVPTSIPTSDTVPVPTSVPLLDQPLPNPESSNLNTQD